MIEGFDHLVDGRSGDIEIVLEVGFGRRRPGRRAHSRKRLAIWSSLVSETSTRCRSGPRRNHSRRIPPGRTTPLHSRPIGISRARSLGQPVSDEELLLEICDAWAQLARVRDRLRFGLLAIGGELDVIHATTVQAQVASL
jgi:hypothetical protein